MSSPGFHLHLRLFLEGIEVPVIGATVSTQLGSAASANIQVVPDDSLLEILPRTVAHLFVLDSMEFEATSPGGRTAGDGYYKLLFCGEVTGIQFSKAGAGSRSASLNCLDFSSVWDTSYAFSLNFGAGDDAVTIQNKSAFLAISQPTFDNIINTPATMTRLIAQQRPSSPGLQGSESVLGGLFSVLEALSGVQGAFMGAGPWPTVHERRTRVLDSIVSDSGETAKKLYTAATFSEWLKDRQGAVGAVSSFRDTINMILGFIFYQFVPNPSPKYVRGEDESGQFPGRDVAYSTKDTLRTKILAEFTHKDHIEKDLTKLLNLDLEFLGTMLELMKGLKAQVGAPLVFGGVDSGFKFDFQINDGWRESVEPSTAHEHGFAMDLGHPQFTANHLFGARMPWRVDTANEAVDQPPSSGSVHEKFRFVLFTAKLGGRTVADLESLRVEAMRDDYRTLWDGERVVAVDKALLLLRALGAWAAIIKKATDQYSELQYGGDLGDWYRIKDPLFLLVGLHNDPVHIQDRDHRDKFAQLQSTPFPSQNALGGNSARERLNSFIFRPDIWFAAPPECNVIYPDQVTSFGMQRGMLRETTRLQLNVAFDVIKDEGEQLDRLAFAPKIPGEESLTQQGLGAADRVIIHDHEVYSGVIPKFERASDLLYYRLKAQTGGAVTKDTVDVFADRLAHFHLLSTRYQARAASVTGVLNTNLVCGFPAVVIDAPLSEHELEQVAQGGRSERAHWLGMISSISHSVTQGGAQTSVSLTHVRSHRTGDRTDDLFSEKIDNNGFLTVQTREETTREQGVVSVTAGVKSAVLNSSGVLAPQSLEQDPTKLYFWEALRVVMNGRNPIQFAMEMGRAPSDLLTATDIARGTPTDFSTAAVSGQVVAIPRTAVPGDTTTTGVVWEGPPATVLVRLTGDIRAESIASGTGYVEVAPRETSVLIPGKLINAVLEAKRSLLFTPPLNEVQSVAEYVVTLPGSTVSIEGVDAESRLGLPIEESIRPTWISEDYSTEIGDHGLTKISERVYQPFFGSSCIVDRVLSKDPPDGLLRQSVEQAVDHLVHAYSREAAKGSRFVLRHIHGVTHRKVATLPQVLGQKHGYIGADGRTVAEKRPPGGFKDEKYALYGGFHSNAVNFGSKDYGSALEFLDLKGRVLRSRYGTDDLSALITDSLDPRAERARRVSRYNGQIRGPNALERRPSTKLSSDPESATIHSTPLGIAKRG